MNFAFAGSPDFAARVLSELDGLGRSPRLVISPPDRPQGRGRRSTPPSAAVEAARLGLECLQTEDINSPAVLERLKAAGVSTLVVAAFGQILRPPVLEAFLCLNIHASLLPVYRGAAPIERALAAGETCTGVSIMRMTEGLDEGPVALQTSVSVGLWDDAGSVGHTLATLGAVGLDRALTGLAEGTLVWSEQQGQASYAAKLRASECVIDMTREARAVHDQVRSLSPSTGARAASGELRLKIWRTWPYGQAGLRPVPGEGAAAAGEPGKVVGSNGRLFVGCAQGAIEVLLIQPAGKGKMNAGAFLRGYGGRLRERLGPWPDGDQTTCDRQ